MKLYGGTAGRGRITLLVALLGALFVAPAVSHAATLFVTPATGQFAVGETFNVVVRVNSQGIAVNASEGVLSFNPAQLQVQGITSTGSIFNLNVQEPEYSNTAGTVRWTGVILNPGYTGTSGNLITIRFKGIVNGTTSVKYSSGAVLANDGAGTNVLAGLSGGTYTIGPSSNPATPAPTPAGDVSAPVVTSPTHPDPLSWYKSNDPQFKWNLPQGVDGVSYLINPKADANPGNASDGVVSEVSFTDVAEGPNYFHVKFRSGGVWGPITHFAFNVDTIAPETFNIVREDAGDTMNPRPLLSYGTTDSGSGVVRYMMRIGEGEWFQAPESSEEEPFAIPLQAPGTRTVEIEAIDRAGNSTRSTVLLNVLPITKPVIVDYPSTVEKGQPFTVGGTADPMVTVRVEAYRVGGTFGRLIYNDAPASSVEVKSDGSGRWTADMGLLPPGEYRLQAVAVDARGALSYPSDPVYVKVGYGIFGRIAEFLHGLLGEALWLLWLLRIVFLLLLLMILSAIAHCGDWRFWTLVAGLPSEERQEASKLSELAADIEDELVLLSKVSKHRPLYPEEKYLKSKLMQYRKTIKFLLKDPHSRLAKRK